MKESLRVYKCLCDETRLRILNLLNHGPLCVCHIQEILDESQVRISKQLSLMRGHGLVAVTRNANWRIYRIPETAPALLVENLKCLQDLKQEGKVFRADLKRLSQLDTSAACVAPELDGQVVDEKCCSVSPQKKK
ncbi:MAG: winged helix-turn-helix transcriptional regulator [Verrucomicrobiae bacterium]|nr:winged helix-turn-helix transcriptional regulator [Verrucomicrobiae bacterium]